MKRQAAKLLTRTHSRAWRARHGAEFEALLEDLPLSLALVIDVAASAARSRRATLTALCLTVVLVLAGAYAVRAPDRSDVAVKPHTFLAACERYSSVERSNFMQHRTCLT